MKLTLDEYSKHFKMSKEMINSKIKTNKLNCIVENGVTYIIVTRNTPNQNNTQDRFQSQQPSKALTKPKTTVATVLALYQKENKQLKDKILQLENKIDALVNDKERMLREERDRIEDVYKSKDQQLKSILKLINTKLLLEQNQTSMQTNTEAEQPIMPKLGAVQNNYSYSNLTEKKEPQNENKLIELRNYLKTLNLKSHQRKIIKKRFLSVYDSDIRIIQQNGKLYLDFSKYDYSDLLAY